MECQSQHLISPFHFITQDIHLCNLCNSYSANNGSSLKTINALWNSKEIKLQQYFWYIKKTMTKKWKKKAGFSDFFLLLFLFFLNDMNIIGSRTVFWRKYLKLSFPLSQLILTCNYCCKGIFFKSWIANKIMDPISFIFRCLIHLSKQKYSPKSHLMMQYITMHCVKSNSYGFI